MAYIAQLIIHLHLYNIKLYGSFFFKDNDIIKENIECLDYFNELNNKLKYNDKLKFDYYKEKLTSELSLAIQTK